MINSKEYFENIYIVYWSTISAYFDTKCARLLYGICCNYKPLVPSYYRKTCGCPLYNFNYAK